MPVDVVGVPTGRADDGLALSSRNQYLTDEQRQLAPQIYGSLKRAATRLQSGEKDIASIQAEGTQALNGAGFKVDYFEVRCAKELTAAGATHKHLVVLVAAYLGKARLIDNIQVLIP